MLHKLSSDASGYSNGPKPGPQKPPRTCDEWLKSSSGAGALVSTDGTIFIPSRDRGAIMWPIHPPHLDYLVAADTQSGHHQGTKVARKHDCPGDTILGSLEEIRADLEKNAPWDSSLLDEVEKKLVELEEGIDISADSFVEEDQQRQPRESTFGGLANVSDSVVFMTELSEELLSLRHLSSSMRQSSKNAKTKQADTRRGTQRLSVVSAAEKSDAEKEQLILDNLTQKTKSDGSERRHTHASTLVSSGSILVPLPGNLDAMAILSLVNSSAKIASYFMQSWKRTFFCGESANILQNAFWWIWLDYFRPKKRIQSLLFNQIAEDFAILFTKMDNKHKDEVFIRYPVYLAQALYSAFCQAFPGSNHELNSSEFLDYLNSTISEWIIGVKSQPDQWKQWPRHFLNPHFLALQQEKDAAKSDEHKHKLTEKDLLSCSRHLSVSLISKISSFTYTTRTSAVTRTGTKKLQNTRASRTRDSLYEIESEESSNYSLSNVEVGPVFECVRFSIHGRSPLLQHYLYQHHLSESKAPQGGLGMSRTQVKEIPSRGVTYKQLLKKQEKHSERLYDEYQSEMERTSHDIAMLHKRHKAYLRKTEMQNQRLLQHRYEVARLAERLVTSKLEGIIDIQRAKQTDS